MNSDLKHMVSATIVISFVLAACSSPAAPVSTLVPASTPPAPPTSPASTVGPMPLPQPAATLSIDELYDGVIKWMDNLKTCTPYSRSYLNPFLQVQQNDTIKGKDGNVCQVTQETVGKYVLNCRYDAEGIKTLTRDELYQQAQNRIMSGGTSDPSTKILNEQCKLTMLSTPSAPTAPTPAGVASMSNPASDNCIKQGGKLTIEKRGDGGEFGVCWFEDARQCEEWALLRSECPMGGLKVTGFGPQGRYCTITGGQYTVTGGDTTNEQGTCKFKDGKTCDGKDYFNGKCNP